MGAQRMRRDFSFKMLCLIQVAIFIFSNIALPATTYAQGVMDLPVPGVMVNRSESYVPVLLRAVKIHPDQPLVFDFIVDSGNTRADQALIKSETKKLVKYFLATLTIPEQDLWVNLSPYEHDRIVPEAFGQTEMGRDLLAQDYMLKQLTSSLVDPEKDLGKEFWARVYAKARETLGSAEIPVDTFNKVWIMPDRAEVYEMNGTAIVGESRLKILMEEDYLALQENLGMGRAAGSDDGINRKLSNDLMREIVLPEIEKEVNTGKNFALLRQVYQSLILATWYKNNLKESLLAKVYANQNKTAGVNADKADKEQIYQRYIAAYKQGVFNYIKEEADPVTHEILPRKYFSGGGNFKDMAMRVSKETKKVSSAEQIPDNVGKAQGDLNQVTVAMAKAEDMVQQAPVALRKISEKRPVIILLGKPGSGKGTVATALRGGALKQISTGDLLREKIAAGTPAGLEAKSYMDKGVLVPDDVIIRMLEEEVLKPENADKGFLFDGFPRTVAQAERLDTFLKEKGMSVGYALHLQVSDEVVVERLGGRWVCSLCGKPYNIKTMPPKVAGKCDDDGTALMQRSDDQEGAIRNRLKTYEEKTAPLINYYQTTGKLENADAGVSVEPIIDAVGVSLGTSEFHEQLAEKVYAYARSHEGKLPISTHKIEKLFRVQDIELKMQNIPQSDRSRFYRRAIEEFARLKKAGAKVSTGVMAGGAASRMSKGKLPQLLIDALHEDPEQFVDTSKFTQENWDVINSDKYKGNFKAYVRDLDADKLEDHDVLNAVLFAPKALLPAAKVDGKWYSLLAYVAMNTSKANDQLEAVGLGRPFIADFMLNNEYRPLIVKSMIAHNFYGLKVAVIKDAQGNVIDLDENDLSNELVIYQQKLAPRLMAPVEVIEAQWQQDLKLMSVAAQEADNKKKQELLDKRFFKNEKQYQYAKERSMNSKGKVLYNTGVPEGHGERWHAQLETTGVGRQVPLYLEGILRKIQYDYFHNIDNMARINDDWMVMFGYFLEKDLGFMMESSLRPFTERGGGGGYDFTRLPDGQLVARQTEDSITAASKTEFGFDSTAEDIEAAKIINGIPNQVPVNNATVFSRSAASVGSVRQGLDAISANLTLEQRNELADELEKAIATGNYKVDLSRFADMLRSNLETVTTLKSIKDPDKKNATDDELVATIVKETFAWSAQQGYLAQGKVGIVLTQSIVDVDQFGAQSESVRFNPLKDRLTYNVPEAQKVRDAQTSAVVGKNAFSEELESLNPADIIEKTKDKAELFANDSNQKNSKQQGGIDFNPATLNFNVARTGKGVQVQFDPAEIEKIKTEGVRGFTPVIINITPVKSMLPALGLAPAEHELAGAVS